MSEVIMYKVVDGVRFKMTSEEIAQFLADIEFDKKSAGGSD